MKRLLMVIPLVILLCFTFGCQDKEAMAELEAMKAQTAVEEQNKEIVLRLYEEMNKGNIEIINEVFAPECRVYYPSNSPKPFSREEVIEGTKMSLRAFPDVNQSIEELFAVGDRVIFRTITTSTHEGEFRGIPATGNKLEYSSIIIVRIENGKIIEEKIEADIRGFMQQLGMELKPREKE